MQGAGVVVAVEHHGHVGATFAQHGPAEWVGADGVELDHAQVPAEVVETDDPVGDDRGFLWIVGDEDGRGARDAQDPTDFAGEVVVEIAVEPGQRLVEQQHAGRRRERAGQGDPLGLAAAELGDGATAEAGQADELEHLGHAAARPRCGRRRCIRNPNSTLACDVAMREQLLVLEHHPDAAPVRRLRGDVAAVQAAPAPRRA